ncbi:protein of unknown function [Burkholderia multivorans]
MSFRVCVCGTNLAKRRGGVHACCDGDARGEACDWRGRRVCSGDVKTGWSPRQESNLYLALRRRLFYPLNYGEPAYPAGCARVACRAAEWTARKV